jgi:hypothetical protein
LRNAIFTDARDSCRRVGNNVEGLVAIVRPLNVSTLDFSTF